MGARLPGQFRQCAGLVRQFDVLQPSVYESSQKHRPTESTDYAPSKSTTAHESAQNPKTD